GLLANGNNATTSVWNEGGDFARFSAGNDANTKSYTVTANQNHTFAGIFVNANGGGDVTVNGPGILTMATNTGGQGFFVGAPSASSNLRINAVIAGPANTQFVWQSSTSGGSLFLNGNNTFAGGVLVNTGQGLNFNNDHSFGTGTITWGVSSITLAA